MADDAFLLSNLNNGFCLLPVEVMLLGVRWNSASIVYEQSITA
jgi:hypothetical protein